VSTHRFAFAVLALLVVAPLAQGERFADELLPPPPPPIAAPSPLLVPPPPEPSVLVPGSVPAPALDPFMQKAIPLAKGDCLCGKSSCGCHQERHIRYRHEWVPGKLDKRVCCTCDPPARAVLQVTDPCCRRCPVEIPVCVPVCCTGTPQVKSRCGLLGRGYITYEWCCGFTIRVVFQLDGDIVVHYHKGHGRPAKSAPLPVEFKGGLQKPLLAL
jgi:hypothetical protein